MFLQHSIFKGISQSLIDVGGHSCTLPLFYTGGTATAGVFPARLSNLRAKSPGSEICPAEIFPRVGAVVVIAFEFETTIGPVNEVCVAVPLKSSKILPDSVSMLKGLLQGQIPVWIWHLPVSTEIADIFGRTTWGFPKIHADIPIIFKENMHFCHLSYEGEPILTLQGNVPDGKFNYQICMKNHLWQNDHLQTADHLFDFNQIGFSLRPGALTLELLSDHLIATDLRDVLLSKRSIAALRASELQAILFEPDLFTY
ncbi:hypothetical protein P23_1074 [Acinetobacter calcoaceticus]|uniref:acetoacetate decarboxylase family protein n=1 Tax=Acinetobacter calcoaceticus TaxID=471 RepID=UPI000582502E|nr:acetoacetate decarboxylase family protein [Acinetobacter calcoaceticus]GAM30571.1 hypothetical protein P23_1074 [Acinetobacter calcoaceticus]